MQFFPGRLNIVFGILNQRFQPFAHSATDQDIVIAEREHATLAIRNFIAEVIIQQVAKFGIGRRPLPGTFKPSRQFTLLFERNDDAARGTFGNPIANDDVQQNGQRSYDDM